MTRTLTLALALALAAGCHDAGPKRLTVVPVSGKVTVAGQPAEKAMVTFHPVGVPPGSGLRPLAQTAADGTYRLTTYLSGDGAPAGDYTVTVTVPGGVPPPKDPDEPPPDRLKGRYADPAKSPWKVTVAGPGPTEFDIKIP